MTARPNLHAAIADHRQLHSVTAQLAQISAEVICAAFGPIKENIDANEIFLRDVGFSSCTDRFLRFGFLVGNSLENLRPLAESFGYSFGKFFGADFLFAHFLVIDVVGVNAVFNCAQPRIVHLLCRVSKPKMYQHHDSSEEQTGWIRKVLTSTSGSRTVN